MTKTVVYFEHYPTTFLEEGLKKTKKPVRIVDLQASI
jgi:hypothetical protein